LEYRDSSRVPASFNYQLCQSYPQSRKLKAKVSAFRHERRYGTIPDTARTSAQVAVAEPRISPL
jgi:hypothetical protein